MTQAERDAIVRWLVREEPGYLGRSWFKVLGVESESFAVRDAAEHRARQELRRVLKGVEVE